MRNAVQKTVTESEIFDAIGRLMGAKNNADVVRLTDRYSLDD